jgi:hypothetical protein
MSDFESLDLLKLYLGNRDIVILFCELIDFFNSQETGSVFEFFFKFAEL